MILEWFVREFQWGFHDSGVVSEDLMILERGFHDYGVILERISWFCFESNPNLLESISHVLYNPNMIWILNSTCRFISCELWIVILKGCHIHSEIIYCNMSMQYYLYIFLNQWSKLYTRKTYSSTNKIHMGNSDKRSFKIWQC